MKAKAEAQKNGAPKACPKPKAKRTKKEPAGASDDTLPAEEGDTEQVLAELQKLEDVMSTSSAASSGRPHVTDSIQPHRTKRTDGYLQFCQSRGTSLPRSEESY